MVLLLLRVKKVIARLEEELSASPGGGKYSGTKE